MGRFTPSRRHHLQQHVPSSTRSTPQAQRAIPMASVGEQSLASGFYAHWWLEEHFLVGLLTRSMFTTQDRERRKSCNVCSQAIRARQGQLNTRLYPTSISNNIWTSCP